jgi:ATP-binding cassette subfamily B protein
LLILTLLSLFFEILNLISIIPFIGILTEPTKIYDSNYVNYIKNILVITKPADLVIPISIIFAFLSLFTGFVRLILLWITTRLGNQAGAEISVEIYKKTLYQPYYIHIQRSSSEIISGITQKVSITTSILVSFTTLISTITLFLSIIGTLLFVDATVALIAMVCFGLAYFFVVKMTRSRLINNSKLITEEQTNVIKSLQEGLGAIRDVLLDNSQKIYTNIYQKAIVKLQNATGENTFMSQAPRYGMEALGMSLIAILVLVLSYRPGGIGAVLATLGMLALSAQKLLPLMQQIFANWSTIIGNKSALNNVIELLGQELPIDSITENSSKITFKSNLILNNVWFRYSKNTPWILEGINMTIKKGSRVGFVGPTGSGKTTTLDILMGLLSPVNGFIKVDDLMIEHNNQSSLRKLISHVPQSIFLTDNTIAENIAFGIPRDKIDQLRLIESAKQAQILDFIQNTENGFKTTVGERGVRLSGGQRQRIGIARALYKKAEILIFDEATSALDSKTEEDVMLAIENLSDDLTILIIAHRTSTLSKCDYIVRLEKGKSTIENPENISN